MQIEKAVTVLKNQMRTGAWDGSRYGRAVRALLDERERMYAPPTHDELNEGLSEAHSESYRLGWRAGKEVAENEYDQILRRQGDLLTRTVNVLKGNPPALVHWSHHDIPDLAKKVVDELEAESARLDRIREVLAKLRVDADFGRPDQPVEVFLNGSGEYLDVRYVEEALSTIYAEFENEEKDDDA